MPSISVVVPVYQAELNLRALYGELIPAIEGITDRFEIIFVEDCGKDRSWEIICDLATQDARVRGFRFRRNFGQHHALLCGIVAARCEVIVTVDDDLQHPVDHIKRLINKLEDGYDVVYGTPEAEVHGLMRNAASVLAKLMLGSVMGLQLARKASAFRAFRTALREGFQRYHGMSASIDVFLAWTTDRFAVVDVPHRPRAAGKSGYTFCKLARHAWNIATGLSTFPLKFAAVVGFVFILLGIVTLGWVLTEYMIHGVVVPGFTFLASVIVMFSGVQLFALGVIGDYLGRLYMQSFDRPAFLVGETCGGAEPKFLDRSRHQTASGV
ncbi:MAG: glycosyltransferase family 2 protein [Candidatus Binataceae bacterium]